MQAQPSAYQRVIDVNELKLGMYVSQLDRPWLETRFLFQGFTLNNETDLIELRKLCRYVIIDIERGIEAERYLAPESASERAQVKDQLQKILERRGNSIVYEDQTNIDEELEAAREIRGDLNKIVGHLMDEVRAGNKMEVKSMRSAVNGMIQSILRNPDAFIWLARLKQTDFYSYAHSIDTCSLAIAFGRHLGLSQVELEHLAIGTLLLDIGKMRLPKELLNKPGRLTEIEFTLIRKHVLYSVEEMQKIGGIAPQAIELAMHHHERFNGNGYPNGVSGTEIPVFGRIAALVDCYDAITSDRAYASAVSQHAAIKKLYELRNVDFQEALVEQFIQCVGIYPISSLVELSSGEVGVVLAQNRIRRLRPKVMLVLDQKKVAYDFSPIVDLMITTTDKDGNPLEISQPLEPGAYGINPKDYYL